MHILRKTFFSKEQQKNFKFFLRRNIECTPEFIQLDKKCDQSREDYYKAHELAEKQFDIYRKVMNKCAHVYYFEMQFLEILIDKIAHIAQSIMADAKRMEKEVGT